MFNTSSIRISTKSLQDVIREILQPSLFHRVRNRTLEMLFQVQATDIGGYLTIISGLLRIKSCYAVHFIAPNDLCHFAILYIPGILTN